LLIGEELEMKKSPYDAEYNQKEYYWGLEHSALAEMTMTMFDKLKYDGRLLDIGSGEGRDAIYFAKCGLRVDALEISSPGIEKIKQYSYSEGLPIHALHTNMIDYEMDNHYDIIYSMGALQFLPIEKRQNHFENYKKHTCLGGFNAHLVFVEKPFITLAPDWQKNEFFYRSGDLARYYYDWQIIYCEEQIVDCKSGNSPHQHAVSSIIAKKI
jgi:tellurite methyltransferase